MATDMRVRVSQLNSWLQCQQRHDFEYVGYYHEGNILVPRMISSTLRDGQAFGIGAAHYHEHGDLGNAILEIGIFYSKEIEELVNLGVPVSEEDFQESMMEVMTSLERHAKLAPQIHIINPEFEMEVTFPEYRGVRITLVGHLDGVHVDKYEHNYPVEFKLRSQINDLWMIYIMRQIRWYSVLYQHHTGTAPHGLIYDETIKGEYSPVKINNDGSVSKVQSCKLEDYLDACENINQKPDDKVIDSLKKKVLHQRHMIPLSDYELKNIANEIWSCVQQFIDFIVSKRMPVRDPNKAFCRNCAYRMICPNPEDTELAKAEFIVQKGNIYLEGVA